jgi:hypothetical protein
MVGERLPINGNLTIKCFEHNGNVKWQNNPAEFQTSHFSSPSLGDIDNDGKLEVLVGFGESLYSFNAEDGTPTNFPVKHTLGTIMSSPLISDIDNDGKLEIIVTTKAHLVYCWEAGECDIGEVEWGMFHRDSYNSGVYYPTHLVLKNITVGIDKSIGYQASDTITAAGESSYFTIEGNDWIGGNVRMSAGDIIYLKPGFHAQKGCYFHTSIDKLLKPLRGGGTPRTLASLSKASRALTIIPQSEKDSSKTSAETASEKTKELIPTVFSCTQNLPNPFNINTTIKYGLPKSSDVSLCVYNLTGQKVQTLVDAQQSAGYKSVAWDGKNSAGQEVPRGIYFYVFKAGDFTKHSKMIVVR